MGSQNSRQLTQAEKSWIFYDVGNSAFVLVMVTAIMPIFFKDYAAKGLTDAVATANWGFANAAASLVLALLSPILGTISDYKNMKMRMFVIFLTIGLLFTGTLLFVGEGMWLLCLTLFVLARIGWAGANLFYEAAIVDVVDDGHHSGDPAADPVYAVNGIKTGPADKNKNVAANGAHRREDRQPDAVNAMDRISSLGYGWGYIGSVIPFLLVIALIMTAGSDNPPGTASAEGGLPVFQTKVGFAIVLIWWAVFSIPMLFNVKQKYAMASSKTPVADSFKRLVQTFHEIRTRHRQVFLFLLAYFFYIDGVGTIISMSGAYGRDLGFSIPLLIGVILFIQVVAFPFALLYGRLALRFSAPMMLKVGILIYCMITLIAFSLPVIEDLNIKIAMFWLIAFLVASSMGGLQALSRSYFAALIPPDKSGEFFGFYNVFGKFAAISGPFLMGVVGRLSGDTRWGVLSLLVLFVAGGILLRKASD